MGQIGPLDLVGIDRHAGFFRQGAGGRQDGHGFAGKGTVSLREQAYAIPLPEGAEDLQGGGIGHGALAPGNDAEAGVQQPGKQALALQVVAGHKAHGPLEGAGHGHRVQGKVMVGQHQVGRPFLGEVLRDVMNDAPIDRRNDGV